MEIEDKILKWSEREIKNVKAHKKAKNNTELILAYYDGYETAMKELKKKIAKFKKEEEIGWQNKIE